MIVVRLKGGMGNQMFQYAFGRILALKNNTELVFDIDSYLGKSANQFKNHSPVRTYDLHVFNTKGNVIKQKNKFKSVFNIIKNKIFDPIGFENEVNRYNSKLFLLGPSSYIDGYFQSPKYFAGYEDVIKKDFTVKNPLPNRIETLANEILNNNSLCVHVRRGDFVGNPNHEVVNHDYYERAINLMRSKVKIDRVYVFSDDINWCKENLKFEIPTTYIEDEYRGEKGEGHMFLMRLCKNFIIPNSSFSWWAAWLSENKDKVVICPKLWYPPNVKIDTSDLIPESWIKI